jgi:glyoxylase-like metal-dependent hydrolase (beta-lactamase superfamily II)
MHILTYPLGQLQANCYIVIQDNKCIIIDPGDSADFLLEEILRKNLNVSAILATHGHFDHMMAVGELQLSLHCPFYIHEIDLFLVKRLKQTAHHFLGYEPVIFQPQQIAYINPDTFQIPEFDIKAIYTPGHTPGSCSFYVEQENALFTGDTLFSTGLGSYDHAYSDKKKLFSSVAQLKKIDAILYPGHG